MGVSFIKWKFYFSNFCKSQTKQAGVIMQGRQDGLNRSKGSGDKK